MIDIHEYNSFNLKEETKDLLVVLDLEVDVVKELDNALNNSLSRLGSGVHKISTLGYLESKYVYVIAKEDISRTSLRKLVSMTKDCVVLLDSFSNDENAIQMLTEEIFYAHYDFDLYREKKAADVNFYYAGGEESLREVITKGYYYGYCVNKARELVDSPYNKLNAIDLADYALKLNDIDNVEVTVFDKNQIEDMNMNAYLAVNKGSMVEPRLIYVKYQGKETFENPTALVGKGVMFDTGGYSLKTPLIMPGMKTDMGGSAAVLAAIEGLARLKVKENIIAVVAATDNMIGDGAYVPDDIITAANGKTIEIVSTDAEGRLTLIDAMHFASKQGAKKIVDVATLTGGMVLALGKEYTGLFGNDLEFIKELEEAASKAGENVWHLPIKGFEKYLKSNNADIANVGLVTTGGRRQGQANQAAAFLQFFLEEDTKWCHLDIAGTAAPGWKATGVMTKTLIELFMK